MSYWFEVRPKGQIHDNFEKNVTYNVSTMLKRAGFHPAILNGITVIELRPVVLHSLALMLDHPEYFEQWAPANGWGSVKSTTAFLEELHTYLIDAPDLYELRVL